MSDPGVVDLGGCEGCALGCAVACASGGRDKAREARRTLVATGLALAVLAGVPGLVSASAGVGLLGLAAALAGAATSGLALLALRRGRPGGDPSARLAYRVMPVGVAGMVATWLALTLAMVLG